MHFSVRTVVAAAMLGGAPVVADCVTAGPAWAAAPYQATVSDKGCNGLTSCTLTFAAVPAGTTLLLTHVSCGIVTSGQLGGVTNVVLTSSRIGIVGDHLQPLSFGSGSNIQTVVNAGTTLAVPSGDRPRVEITSSTAVSATPDGGCLLSGSTSP